MSIFSLHLRIAAYTADHVRGLPAIGNCIAFGKFQTDPTAFRKTGLAAMQEPASPERTLHPARKPSIIVAV
jgi:hypothetical protein